MKGDFEKGEIKDVWAFSEETEDPNENIYALVYHSHNIHVVRVATASDIKEHADRLGIEGKVFKKDGEIKYHVADGFYEKSDLLDSMVFTRKEYQKCKYFVYAVDQGRGDFCGFTDDPTTFFSETSAFRSQKQCCVEVNRSQEHDPRTCDKETLHANDLKGKSIHYGRQHCMIHSTNAGDCSYLIPLLSPTEMDINRYPEDSNFVYFIETSKIPFNF